MKCDNCGEQITKAGELVVAWNEDWKIDSNTFNKDPPKFIFHKQFVNPECDDRNKYPLSKTFPNESSLEKVEEYVKRDKIIIEKYKGEIK